MANDESMTWNEETQLDEAMNLGYAENPKEYMHDLGMMGFQQVVPWNLPNVRY